MSGIESTNSFSYPATGRGAQRGAQDSAMTNCACLHACLTPPTLAAPIWPAIESWSRVLELAAISTSKNTVAGDKSALGPSGLRLCTSLATFNKICKPRSARDLWNAVAIFRTKILDVQQ